MSPLYGFLSSGTPLIRGSLGNRSSTKAMVSAQFAATCCPRRRQKQSQLKHTSNVEFKLLCSNIQLPAADPLTAVLGVLTSFFNWSSSIFRISLSDISRAILAAGAHEELLSYWYFSNRLSFLKPFCKRIPSTLTCWMAGLPVIREKSWLWAHQLVSFFFTCTVTCSDWSVASYCSSSPADPCCWLLGEVVTGLDLMSPIRRDGIKWAGAVTPEQEGGNQEREILILLLRTWRESDLFGQK